MKYSVKISERRRKYSAKGNLGDPSWGIERKKKKYGRGEKSPSGAW